jgi:heme exporter protein D
VNEFFQMGGYALYVWPSYALAAIVLIYNILSPILTRKKIMADIARKARRAKRGTK